MLEAYNSCPTAGCLPPLLERQSQNPMESDDLLVQQTENDLKNSSCCLISNSQFHHHLFPINGQFQTSTIISAMPNSNNTSPSPSMLFKSLLSHQDFTLKQQINSENTIQKHCKTEAANFSHFQLPDDTSAAANSWMDKIQPNPYQNPLFFEIDCSFPGFTQGFTTTATGTGANDMSTSAAFNRSNGFQVMCGESWPLDA